MPHGVSWLTFFPGYHQLEAFLRGHFGKSFIGHQEVSAQPVAGAILVFIIVIVLAIIARTAMKKSTDVLPDEKLTPRNFFEIILEATLGLMKDIIGPEAPRYFTLIAALAVFILFSNLLGAIPGFTPPTTNLNTTVACALVVFMTYHWVGVRKQGFFKYFGHMANPVGVWWGWILAPLMFPIEIISNLARPLSLSVRLMGNMMGDHAVLAIFLGLVPLFVPIPFELLGLLVAVIQTLVFCLLSVVYISLAVAESDEHGH